MGSHLRWAVALLAALAIGRVPAQVEGNPNYSPYHSTPLVHCASNDSARTYCAVETHGRVRIARQVSREPCVSGESWGYNDHGIWVSHGCRADFAVGPGGYRDRYRDDGNSMYVDRSGHLVHCIATDNGRTYCGGRHAGYTYSGAPNPNCIEGQTWGYDDRGVWVSGQCNGDFTYVDSDGVASSTYVDSSGRLVHCVATESGRTYCGTRHARYTLSGNPNPYCVQGQSWGFDDRGVWVSGRCNGDFTYIDSDDASSSSTYVDSSGRLVHCVSTESGRTYCGTRHARYTLSGNPNPSCIQGQTWGYDERGVWVTGGCNADFSYVDSDDASTNSSTYVDSSGRLVHCVSTASGRTYCGTQHVRYTLSGNPNPYCIQGQTWGYDERGVWVSGQCRGDFAYFDADDAAGRTTYVASTGHTIHCVAEPNGRTYCGARHLRYSLYGNPNPYCVQGQTWGYDERGVWVSGQCVGDFRYYDSDD